MTYAPFTPTQDLALFFSDTTDRVRVRSRFATWQSSAGAHGCISWGRMTEVDVADMCEAYGAQQRSPHAHWPSIIDARSVESLSVDGFELFVRTLLQHRSTWSKGGRHAVVHGGGFAGALILGALQIAASGYQLAAFSDLGAALAWLGAPQIEPDVATLRASILDAPDVVRRVRAVLEAQDRPLSAQALSRRVGLSTRSLQRQLAAAGTSVRTERAAHVVARAERLLEGTDLDLAAIAAMIGLRSPGRLVSIFRATRQTTPDAWRRAAR